LWRAAGPGKVVAHRSVFTIFCGFLQIGLSLVLSNALLLSFAENTQVVWFRMLKRRKLSKAKRVAKDRAKAVRQPSLSLPDDILGEIIPFLNPKDIGKYARALPNAV
jgi:hypothetical protein